jgi:hypothetical protein
VRRPFPVRASNHLAPSRSQFFARWQPLPPSASTSVVGRTLPLALDLPKTLELSCKGDERVQLLRWWLVVLKETQRATTVVREPQLGDNPDQTVPLLVSIPPWLLAWFAECFGLHYVIPTH